MIVYYAPGGGLGHLTRATRVLAALDLEATIVTTSTFDIGRDVIRVPASLDGHVERHRDFLGELGATRIIADTFPGGIQGELCGLDVPIDLVARILRWPVYREVVPFDLPDIETMYVVEELNYSLGARNVVPLDLTPPLASSEPLADHWLVVHSGPSSETDELIAYARDLGAPDVVVADVYPATPLFASAARIVTAAGFNTMLEMRQFAHKHHVLPLPRKFDDQYLRASRARSAQQRDG